ncbi:hypothetical protein G7046_g5809 [Stylonectria norvegica]|nr:hypothetical protein G7046_g5809 [Stylonectria norvegica]
MSPHPTLKATFAKRASTATHPLNAHLFKLMDLKASNLCLSADVATARELLAFANKIGPSIVVLKTHHDMVAGWDYHPQTGTGAKLAALARKHGFLIFEDRKFGDIGNTVELQYTAGSARIIDWAHIVNVNMVPGKASVTSLAKAAARWLERYPYEVKTSITIGTPTGNEFDDSDSENAEMGGDDKPLEPVRGENGRKGSIVSTTTVTQQYEPADSPRLVKSIAEGDEALFAGIEEAPIERGLLILAQMSTEGNFMNKEYTQACVEAAREHKDFVMGFVSQESLNSEPDDDFIHMTPGCQLPPDSDDENTAIAGDGKGQQYNTPHKIIGIAGADICIVGRGIIKAGDPQGEAERYRSAAWKAYTERCDRELPCANCRSRNKDNSCTYDEGAPRAVDRQAKRPSVEVRLLNETELENLEPLSQKATDWGYAQNGVSTIGFLKKIETADGEHAPNPVVVRGPLENDSNLKDKYKGLIRQLPAKIYLEKLIDMYVRGFNWQYYALEADILYAQLEEWNSLPFKVLTSDGPQGLSPDLQAFPALLFQIIGTALLLLPERPDPVFDALKYAGNMKFEDLAIDYSESGAAIVDLLGKKNLSLTTIQSQFLRASFLKFTAKVTEAVSGPVLYSFEEGVDLGKWHMIAVTVRDAQELGMHRDDLDPKPKDSSLESLLQNQWLIQRRRKMYILLAVWDLNCSVVLGRPGMVDWNQQLPTLPVDAPIPADRSRTLVAPRDEEKDPPTPLTRMLWNYHMCMPLQAIQNLEKDGPYPKDTSKIDRVQQSIMDLDDRAPPVLRLDNPDTQWDNHPDMHWIQAGRYYAAQMLQFCLMALHRPYVFYRKASRVEAIQASLRMLEIQKMTFNGLPPDSWRNFMLFFGSFDAIVLIASVYILFPHEHAELTGSVHQHFQWTIDRFSAIQHRNPLAKSAQGVLRAIVARFKKSVAQPTPASSTDPGSSRTPASDSTSRMNLNLDTPPTPASSLAMAGGFVYPAPSTVGSEWMVPSADSLAAIAPMFPTGDLIFNDLNAVHEEPPLSQGDGVAVLDDDDFWWQFGGDLGDDTVWQFLNQLQPAGDQSQHMGDQSQPTEDQSQPMG